MRSPVRTNLLKCSRVPLKRSSIGGGGIGGSGLRWGSFGKDGSCFGSGIGSDGGGEAGQSPSSHVGIRGVLGFGPGDEPEVPICQCRSVRTFSAPLTAV